MKFKIILALGFIVLGSHSTFAQPPETKLYDFSTLELLMSDEIFKEATEELKRNPQSKFKSLIQTGTSFLTKTPEGKIIESRYRCYNTCVNFRLTYESPISKEDSTLRECFAQFQITRTIDFVLVEKPNGWSEWVETENFSFSRIGTQTSCL